MKRIVYLSVCLATGCLFGASPVRAQYILAGQTAGVTYVDLVPDKKISVFLAGPTSQRDSLDLDGDGRFDLRLTASIGRGKGVTGPGSPYSYSGLESTLRALHNDVAIAAYPFAPLVWRRASQDTIQQRLVTYGAPAASNLDWLNKTSSAWGYARLTYQTGSPMGNIGDGFWNDANEGYVALRLRANASQQWRYGWLRIQVTPRATLNDPDFNEVSIIVKDYTFTSGILSQRSALAAGWRLTPIPTSNWLTVTAPVATKGHLVLEDVCGRQCLTASFAGTQQLDLSSLTTGMYLLLIHTAAGSFVQRVIKN